MKFSNKEPLFTALYPIQKDIDFTNMNDPIMTLGMNQDYLNGMSGNSTFYSGFYGVTGQENDVTKYKHKQTDTTVEFGTFVNCHYDLSCGDLTANSLWGPAVAQIQTAIESYVDVNTYTKAENDANIQTAIQNVVATTPTNMEEH